MDPRNAFLASRHSTRHSTQHSTQHSPRTRSRPTACAIALTALPLAGFQAGCEPPPPDYGAVFDGRAGRWVDLSHSFSDGTIYWPTDTLGFQLEELAYGPTEGGWFYSSYAFSTAEHGGTHLDSPIHFAEGRLTTDRIPLSSLIGPAAVVDITARATPDYLLSVEDLVEWEAANGEIPAGAILLIQTGWGERWDDPTAYLGTSLTGPDAVAELHFPGISEEAATWLTGNREIAAVGIDTPSIDRGQSVDFRAHVILYADNIPGFENVAGLEQLPPVGSHVVALPMKIEGGSGGPLRIVAFVPTG
jgi:kynurenine formamidase